MMELEKWQTKEKIRLKQKSHELWLKEGDRNSKFFHASTLIIRRRNTISEIELENGERIMVGRILKSILEIISMSFLALQIHPSLLTWRS